MTFLSILTYISLQSIRYIYNAVKADGRYVLIGCHWHSERCSKAQSCRQMMAKKAAKKLPGLLPTCHKQAKVQLQQTAATTAAEVAAVSCSIRIANRLKTVFEPSNKTCWHFARHFIWFSVFQFSIGNCKSWLNFIYWLKATCITLLLMHIKQRAPMRRQAGRQAGSKQVQNTPQTPLFEQPNPHSNWPDSPHIVLLPFSMIFNRLWALFLVVVNAGLSIHRWLLVKLVRHAPPTLKIRWLLSMLPGPAWLPELSVWQLVHLSSSDSQTTLVRLKFGLKHTRSSARCGHAVAMLVTGLVWQHLPHKSRSRSCTRSCGYSCSRIL